MLNNPAQDPNQAPKQIPTYGSIQDPEAGRPKMATATTVSNNRNAWFNAATVCQVAVGGILGIAFGSPHGFNGVAGVAIGPAARVGIQLSKDAIYRNFDRTPNFFLEAAKRIPYNTILGAIEGTAWYFLSKSMPIPLLGVIAVSIALENAVELGLFSLAQSWQHGYR